MVAPDAVSMTSSVSRLASGERGRGVAVTRAGAPAPSSLTARISNWYVVPFARPRNTYEPLLLWPGPLSGIVDQSGFQVTPPSELRRYSKWEMV